MLGFLWPRQGWSQTSSSHPGCFPGRQGAMVFLRTGPEDLYPSPSQPRLAQSISHSHYPQTAFPIHPVRSTRGLMQTSWGLSIFPECICFSRRQHGPRCLKAHLGPPVGCLRLPHSRKLVSHFLITPPPLPFPMLA